MFNDIMNDNGQNYKRVLKSNRNTVQQINPIFEIEQYKTDIDNLKIEFMNKKYVRNLKIITRIAEIFESLKSNNEHLHATENLVSILARNKSIQVFLGLASFDKINNLAKKDVDENGEVVDDKR